MKALKFSSLTLTASLLVTGLSMPEAKAEYHRESGGGYSTQDGLVQQMGSSSSFLIAEHPEQNRHLGGRNDPHGKGDDLPSLERQLKRYKEELEKAKTRKEKVRIKNKIKNVQEEIRRRRKGETHHNSNRLRLPDPPRLADTL